jgi:hypothetical protein
MSIQAGDVYSRLTVVESGSNINQHRTWKCRCECGKFYIAREDKLLAGRTKSCGCLRAEISAEQKTIADLARQQQELTATLHEARKTLALSERLFNRQAGQYLWKNSGVAFPNPTGMPPEDMRHFEKTGSPKQVAALLRLWSSMIAEVLGWGSEADELTITVNISRNKPKS